MVLGVPGQGRDAVALLHAQPRQHARHPKAAVAQIGIADPVDPSAVARGHHLAIGTPLGGVVQELVERQGERLHLAINYRH